MNETDQGYTVLKVIEATKVLLNSYTETYRIRRRKLVETKIMAERGGILVFPEDALFNSPSAASNRILERNSNG